MFCFYKYVRLRRQLKLGAFCRTLRVVKPDISRNVIWWLLFFVDREMIILFSVIRDFVSPWNVAYHLFFLFFVKREMIILFSTKRNLYPPFTTLSVWPTSFGLVAEKVGEKFAEGLKLQVRLRRKHNQGAFYWKYLFNIVLTLYYTPNAWDNLLGAVWQSSLRNTDFTFAFIHPRK